MCVSSPLDKILFRFWFALISHWSKCRQVLRRDIPFGTCLFLSEARPLTCDVIREPLIHARPGSAGISQRCRCAEHCLRKTKLSERSKPPRTYILYISDFFFSHKLPGVWSEVKSGRSADASGDAIVRYGNTKRDTNCHYYTVPCFIPTLHKFILSATK